MEQTSYSDFSVGRPSTNSLSKMPSDAGCLVPYRYFIHEVQFSPAEMDLYEDLTEQLVRAGFRVNDNGVTVGLSQTVERLLQRRRALVEQADSKIEALENVLKTIKPAGHHQNADIHFRETDSKRESKTNHGG